MLNKRENKKQGQGMAVIRTEKAGRQNTKTQGNSQGAQGLKTAGRRQGLQRVGKRRTWSALHTADNQQQLGHTLQVETIGGVLGDVPRLRGTCGENRESITPLH